jgi:hypothetical protein
MLVAYFTTDEVNRSLALEMARQQGLTLLPVEPRDGPPDEVDALLFDWDYWPVPRREAALAELLAGAGRRPVALHSYHVEAAQAEGLRRRGVAVHRRLQPDVFRSLRQAVLAARVRKACGEDQEGTSSTGRPPGAA